MSEVRLRKDRYPGGHVEVPASKTLSRAIGVLEAVAVRSRQPLRLVEVVEITGLTKTTAHRILGGLCEGGLLRIDPDGRYAPGPLLLSMGMNFLQQTDVREAAKGAMQRLTEVSQETSHLGVMHLPWVVYLEKVESPQQVRMHSQVGAMNPVHTTALGKAMLAFCDADVVASVTNRPMIPATTNSITSPEAFRADLEMVRERGFAIDDIENELSIRCVAAPILDHRGCPIAAISLAGPATRVTHDFALEFGPIVAQSSQEVSQRMGFIQATSPN